MFYGPKHVRLPYLLVQSFTGRKLLDESKFVGIQFSTKMYGEFRQLIDNAET
jgi:hypothetical protein